MANISEYISKIRTAIYGKDVRGSLADGLDAVNKETEAATALSQEIDRRQTSIEKQFDDQIANMTLDDPSSAELVAGRTNVNTGKSYDTIGRRLDAEYADVTAQLAEETNKREQIAYLVTDFGAVGDGVTDDTNAIQNAINALTKGGVLFFPQGKYRVTSPINLTNNSKGIELRGVGSSDELFGSTIIGETGSCVFDLTGALKVRIVDINVVNGSTNPSTIGFLLARSTTVQYAEFLTIENVFVKLSSIPTANNNKGTIGIYNYCAELGRYRNIFVQADIPVVFTVDNVISASSTYTTINPSPTSMSECTIDGASTLIALTGVAVWMRSAVNITLDNIYINASNTNPTTYAFQMDNQPVSIDITGHIETFKQCMSINTVVYDLRLKMSRVMYSGDAQIVLQNPSAGITGGDIRLIPTGRTGMYTNVPLIKSMVENNGVRNCFIYLDQGQILNINGGYTTGNIITAYDSNPTVIESGSGGFYSSILVHRSGIKMHSPVEITDPVTIDSNLTVSTYFKLTPISATNAANGSLFVDSADNKLKFKDSAGNVNLLY